MQPLKLELHYFGPYKDEEINFQELTGTPVFLVSGNTGSGKTTLFDAMCYALFGQTTNDQDRDAAALRSDFAPRDQETSVTFTFVHQQKKYQITRKPKQQLLGRGQKLVEHPAKVSLIYPLDDPEPKEITKVGPANNFIEQLLNLNRDQFKQIVLLPQGKFRQFLESSSSEKETLLRDLFGTSLYERWAQVLKDRLADEKKDHQETMTKLTTVKAGLGEVDENLPTVEWLTTVNDRLKDQTTRSEKISREITTQNSVVEKINQQISAEQTLINELDEQQQITEALQELQKQKPTMTEVQETVSRLDWYQKRQKDYLDYQHFQEDTEKQTQRMTTSQLTLQSLQDKRATLEKTAKHLQSQQKEIDHYQERYNVLKSQLPQYARMTSLATTIQEQQKLVTDQKQAFDTQATTLLALQKQLTEITAQLGKDDNLDKQELDLEKRRHELKEVNGQLIEYRAHRNKQVDLENRIKDRKHSNAKQQRAIDEAKAAYLDLKDAHARSEIALLAKELKPGSPCPVCGATDHPHPANVTDIQRIVSRDQVESANQKLTRLMQEQAAGDSQLTEWRQQLDQEQQTIKELLTTLNKLMGTVFTSFEEVETRLKEKQESLDSAAQKLADKKQKRATLEAQRTTCTDQKEMAQKHLTELQTELADVKMQLAQNQATYQNIADNLEGDYADEQAATKQLKIWQGQIDDFTRAQVQNQTALAEVNEQRGTQERLFADAHSTLENDQQQAQQLKEQLTRSLAQFSPNLDWGFWEWAKSKLENFEELQSQLREYQTELARLQARHAELAEKIDGQKRPEIEQSRAKLKTVQDHLATLQQERGELQSQLKNTQNTYQRVQKLEEQQTAALKKIQDLQTVSDVMNGNTDNKLSLERYVLQNYLSQVLRVANERLAKLTNGRYAFQLSTEQGRGNGTKWSGLEINVYDDNAGQSRSVRTLSGGESFIASLALALGLGEVIQEQSGGIQVDALFIDEGFGSLDQEALNHALAALQTIEGYQMIGIISHVTELENQIPNQLQVISRNGVSHVHYRHEIANL